MGFSYMELSIAVAAKGVYLFEEFFQQMENNGMDRYDDIEIVIAHDVKLPSDIPRGMNIKYINCIPGTSILKLWGQAIAQSSGNYVAVLDINCPPALGWLDRVLNEITAGNSLFFGPVNPPDKIDSSILGYITEYAQFCSPIKESMNEVPGNNIVCRRTLMDSNDRLINEGFLKTFMVWRLEHEESLKPVRFNDMAVDYKKKFKYQHYMVRRFLHGRCFAATRLRQGHHMNRVVYICMTPALPILRIWRIYLAVSGSRKLKLAFLRYFYAVLHSELAWSYGEFMGYSFGENHTCSRLY